MADSGWLDDGCIGHASTLSRTLLGLLCWHHEKWTSPFQLCTFLWALSSSPSVFPWCSGARDRTSYRLPGTLGSGQRTDSLKKSEEKLSRVGGTPKEECPDIHFQTFVFIMFSLCACVCVAVCIRVWGAFGGQKHRIPCSWGYGWLEATQSGW